MQRVPRRSLGTRKPLCEWQPNDLQERETRRGKAGRSLLIQGVDYEVTALLTKGKKPYWRKVHAQKASKTTRSESGRLSGGRIV